MGKLTQMFGYKDPYPMKICTIEVVDNQARRKVKTFAGASTNRRTLQMKKSSRQLRPKIGDSHGPPGSTGPAYCSNGFTKPKSKPNEVAMNSDSSISESFDVIDLEFNGEEITSISHIIFKSKEKDDSKVQLNLDLFIVNDLAIVNNFALTKMLTITKFVCTNDAV